jgi:hypothetical protein
MDQGCQPQGNFTSNASTTERIARARPAAAFRTHLPCRNRAEQGQVTEITSFHGRRTHLILAQDGALTTLSIQATLGSGVVVNDMSCKKLQARLLQHDAGST